MGRLSHFGPFPFAFPNAEDEREWRLLGDSLVEQLADVFDRGIVQEIVPGLVVVLNQDVSDELLQVGKIHHHAVPDGSVYDKFDFVGVTMERATLRVSRQKMGTINVVDNSDLHDANPQDSMPR